MSHEHSGSRFNLSEIYFYKTCPIKQLNFSDKRRILSCRVKILWLNVGRLYVGYTPINSTFKLYGKSLQHRLLRDVTTTNLRTRSFERVKEKTLRKSAQTETPLFFCLHNASLWFFRSRALLCTRNVSQKLITI